jgi:hypothetical protein
MVRSNKAVEESSVNVDVEISCIGVQVPRAFSKSMWSRRKAGDSLATLANYMILMYSTARLRSHICPVTHLVECNRTTRKHSCTVEWTELHEHVPVIMMIGPLVPGTNRIRLCIALFR